MQNRYVGDVGDFGKFGLLRSLCGFCPVATAQFSLGVVWYLVSKNEANNDGKHDSYLNLRDEKSKERRTKTYRDCDPDLHHLLKVIRRQGTLSVADLQSSAIFPVGTAFFDKPLSYTEFPWLGPATKEQRIAHRNKWFKEALQKTEKSQVVFVDPDNGLEVQSTAFHALKAPKFVFFEELSRLYERSQSLAIYHHLGMHDGHLRQAKDRANEIDNKLGRTFKTICLRYRRGTERVFFLKPCNGHHEKLFRKRVKALVDGTWGKHQHFELISD